MISLCLPTRRRPANLRRMVESARATAESPEDIEIVAVYDDDDSETLRETAALGIRQVQVPRQSMGAYWSIAAEHAAGDILMLGNDDCVFLTRSWDTLLRRVFSACPDGILYAHGSDGAQHQWSFGALGFVSRKWIRAVGYFTPPEYTSDYCDTTLNWLAEALGRRLPLPFVTEHRHVMFGTAPMDDTYAERYARHAGNHARWEAAAPARQAALERLRSACAEGESLGTILARMSKEAIRDEALWASMVPARPRVADCR